jgi:hypothetical protein
VYFEDITGFEVNMLVDFHDDSDNSSHRVRVTAVTAAAKGNFSAKVAGSVSFKNDVVSPATGAAVALAATAVATADAFYPAGTMAGFDGADTVIDDLVSLDDICGSGATGTLHGITTSEAASWVGHRENLAGLWSQEAGLAFANFIMSRSGTYPDIAILGPQLAAAHAVASGMQGTQFGFLAAPGVNASRHMAIDASMDKYAGLDGGIDGKSKLSIAGAQALVSPFAPATKVRFVNSEYTKLIKWTDIEPEMDGNGKPYRADHDNVGVLIFMSGDMQLITEKRPSCGEIYGVTSL